MTAKQVATEVLSSLPDDCTLSDITYGLYVRQQIEEGLGEIERGEVVSQEEAEAMIDQWIARLNTK